MKNVKNIMLRLLSTVICIVMLLSVVACTPANSNDTEDVPSDGTDKITEKETEPVETMKVVVFSVRAVKGNLLNKYRLELADVPVTELPIDPITNIDDAMGKYLLDDADKGSCVSASMLSSIDPLMTSHGVGGDYVLISDVAAANPTIKDASELIQKAVDENPGKTIYFPDGKYEFTKTVKIPSEPEKSVSFRLSNYATFTAPRSWNTENTALVQYGTPESQKTQSGANSDYIMGGIFDAGGRCGAIEVYGGGRLFINNVSIKNAKIGIHIKPNAAHNVIENVNVTSPARSGTKGIFVEGTNNTFTNMRIYHSFIGAHLTGGDNVLINIHPLANVSSNIDSIGFYDQSIGNRFSVCYSDQYPVGFKMEAQTRSYFDMCFIFWWSSDCNKQIGFMCVGEFNSIISDSIVSMSKVSGRNGSNTENHYLYFVEEAVTPDPTPTPTPTPTPEPNPNPGEDGEEEDNENENDNDNENENESSNRNERAVTVVSPSGKGIIFNPMIQSERNSDSTTYKQFVYNPN